MTSLIFHNPGEIDIRGAYIAGMSAKEDASAIGYFGTGLKYAIARVLANGGRITIWSGLSCHEFSAETIDFRGQAHGQIVMTTQEAGILGDTTDGPITQHLGFTTGYGKQWKAWQIFRELYANALDEGGDVARATPEAMIAHPCPDTTTIIVTGWEELQDQWFNRNEIILPPDHAYDAETETLLVARKPSGYIYFKGVRVASRNALLTWNFKCGLKLTEDRTVEAGSWETAHLVGEFIRTSDCEQIIRTVLTAPKNTFEQSALGWFTAPTKPDQCSVAFATVAADLYRQDPQKYSEYEALALAFMPALREARRVELTHLQAVMLQKAKTLVSKAGFAYEVEHLPIIVENLGGKTLGKYAEGTISLSPLVFDQGTKQVVSTLYEECLHAKLGYRDCTYEMQTHLFNTIIGLYEELWGEPC